MATLTISHYIYLTKEQRYALNDGDEVEVVGICVPVWFDKGTTSEPAHEIFCKYKLTNPKTGVNIKQSEDGFVLVLPSEDTESFAEEEKNNSLKIKLGASESLLDFKDGGRECSEFRLYQKLLINKNLYHLIHFIDIKSKEILIDSLS